VRQEEPSAELEVAGESYQKGFLDDDARGLACRQFGDHANVISQTDEGWAKPKKLMLLGFLFYTRTVTS
jgi:hypothetical protein